MREKLQSLNVGLTVLIVAGTIGCGQGKKGMEKSGEGFVVDTILLGHSVRLSLAGQSLRGGVANEVNIEVDKALDGDWGVFTKTPQGAIQMDTTTHMFLVTPTDATDTVSVYFRMAEASGYGPENPSISIPVHQSKRQ